MKSFGMKKSLSHKIARTSGSQDKAVEDTKAGKAEEKGDSESEKKRLIFLSKRVYKIIKQHSSISGTSISNILTNELKKLHTDVVYKNVQRRVYDALNVFIAIGIATKEKQGMVKYNNRRGVEIFPQVDWTSRIAEKKESISKKRAKLLEYIVQLLSLRKLIARNQSVMCEFRKISTPFLVLYPNGPLKIESPNEGNNVLITSFKPFVLQDDNKTLHTLGLSLLKASDFNYIKNEDLRKFASRYVKTIADSPKPLAIASQLPDDSVFRSLFSQEMPSQPAGNRISQDMHFFSGKFPSLFPESQMESQEVFRDPLSQYSAVKKCKQNFSQDSDCAVRKLI